MINVPGLNEVLDVIFRTIGIFFFTYLIIRIRGNKQLSNLSLFDVLLVIALGSAMGDVMIYSEKKVSIVRAFTAITTVVLMIFFIEFIIARTSKKFSSFLYGEPIVLVKNGKLLNENLKKTNMSGEQLKSLLRTNNVRYYSECKLVQLEPNGELSIIRKKNNKKK
ncbi:MAG: DUF421 domain-containing protein [Candidatus Mcinerneyibacterium aminivorans]|uniref:DUF421 domain-containing protein n=1 Tax=Candidatus Mcinerneyibacterium aminivorans TaxID=2703815 RepID=A0A5D0MBI1_9BACT|nr:MAG: DUF421 domain-containing protein [Candidatus Mcinerneyibacterium aminivorans]